MKGIIKDVFGFITFWFIWFYDWEVFFSLFVNLWWLFSDNPLIFWIRVAFTIALIVIWLYLRFIPSEREKEQARRRVF